MTDTTDKSTCSLCGEPMPEGEEMFKYHGYSGPCPKPPIKTRTATKQYQVLSDLEVLRIGAEHSTELPMSREFTEVGFVECVRAIEQAVLAELRKKIGEPVFQYQNLHTKEWSPFVDAEHYENTREDGRWPIRALHQIPPELQP